MGSFGKYQSRWKRGGSNVPVKGKWNLIFNAATLLFAELSCFSIVFDKISLFLWELRSCPTKCWAHVFLTPVPCMDVWAILLYFIKIEGKYETTGI